MSESVDIVRYLIKRKKDVEYIIEDYPHSGYQRELEILETLLELVEAPMTRPPLAEALRQVIEDFIVKAEHYRVHSELWGGEVISPISITSNMIAARDVLRAELERASSSVEASPKELRGEVQPCVICEWPVLQEEGYICACCGFEQGYDDPATWQWNGEWWAKDKSRMPKILRAMAPALRGEASPPALSEFHRHEIERAIDGFHGPATAEILKQALSAARVPVVSEDSK